MKKKKLAVFTLCWGMLLSLSTGQDNVALLEDDETIKPTRLEIVNDGDEDVSVCIGWYDAEENCWMTRGFYRVKPGKSRRIALVTQRQAIYIRAESDSGNTWTWENGKAKLAISGGAAFTIRLADSRFPSFAGDSAKLNFHDSTEEIRRADFFKLIVPGYEKVIHLRGHSEENE